ncbi:hypothetical protein SAMN06297387_102215 [Streptomyces zhaozhouensis]|uniref:Uncharacterized protein n=1 Tax=Streptomyces zhaozhouensis TaxID=1300267 RepID=A0A286DQ86_9ACTN|nr:hypothetical protein [Streptomyces zhaozhouensis]SOD60684.1 hypothetical protein SAMN06297387_102215 [Streptomyces zhaozhouensis]
MDHVSGLPEFWKEFSSLGQEVDYFVTARLFDGTPAVWPQELSYVKWRHLVATELGVDPMAVQLVGSARLGYSMNPRKGFRKFNSRSDLDIAIISPELFDKAWRELRVIIEDEVFSGQKSYLRKLVFEECIALDVVLPRLSFGEQWSRSRDLFVQDLGGAFRGREVNYRLYRNHGALRNYQVKSVNIARDRAIEEGVHHG